MAGTTGGLTDSLKNAVSEKVVSSVLQLGSNGKGGDRTLFGVKLSPDDFEKVSKTITDAATVIGPLLAKSREKTVEAAHNAPGVDKFEEQFSAAIEAIDKRQMEARNRVKDGAMHAREATSTAATNAREATAHAAAESADAGKNLMGLVFWTGAAAAAVYFLILDRERREQLADIARSGANMTRDIVKEVRGEDGQFS